MSTNLALLKGLESPQGYCLEMLPQTCPWPIMETWSQHISQ
jgi:hypothetical protein